MGRHVASGLPDDNEFIRIKLRNGRKQMKNLLSKEALNPRNEEKTGRNRNGSGHTRHGRYGSSCSMTIMTPTMAAGAWCGGGLVRLDY